MNRVRRLGVCAGAALGLLGAGCAEPRPLEDGVPARFADHAEEVARRASKVTMTDGGLELSGDGAVVARFDARGGVTRLATRRGFEISVRELGARGEAQAGEHTVRYARAGGTSFWTAASSGVEEWIHLAPGVARRDQVAAAWEVEGATLRARGDVVEALDERGVTRMRVTAPVAYTARGRTAPLRLDVRGARLELTVDADGEEVLVDPAWISAASMIAPRSNHAAVPLQDGRVFVVGGDSGTALLASAEIYDPVTDSWSPAAPMSTACSLPAAALLPNGKVLVAGGYSPAPLATAEIYDPVTNSWSPAASMSSPRNDHTATALLDGTVLVAAGSNGAFLASAERYDPVTNSWSPAGSLAVNRTFHTATRLANGKVLVSGGYNGNTLASAEIYDPSTNSWSPAGSLATPRQTHGQATLLDGRVLVAGGVGNIGPSGGVNPVYLSSAEIYDPATNSWSPAGSMAATRAFFPLVALGNGEAIAAGGQNLTAGQINTADRFVPAQNGWIAAPNMASGHSTGTGTRLANGRLLVAGGLSQHGFTASAELYDPLGAPAGATCSSGATCATGFCVDGVCCDTACGGGVVSDCQACSVLAGAAHDGTCGPTTGNTCSDGDACTQTDTCQAGVCVGANPIVCTALDPCHSPGTCNPTTGVCSNPPNGNPTCNQVCVTIARGGLGDVADTHIAPDKPSSNWGTSNSLSATTTSSGAGRLALVRYDLSPVPQGAIITQATATMHVLLNGGAPVRVHRVTAPWVEGNVTYASFGNAYLPQVEATLPATSAPSTDLTALVQAWVSGALPNDGVLLERDLGTTTFGSSEYMTGMRPSLDVCYLPPTCSDGVRNQGETGVDCGGPCAPCDLCVNVVCAPADACHLAGTCNPATGQCTSPAAPDGAPCDDGDACTSNDACQSGACVGGANSCQLCESTPSLGFGWPDWLVDNTALSTDGSHLFLAATVSSRLYTIDPSSFTVSGFSTPPAVGNTTMTVDPSTGRFYWGSAASNVFYRLSPTGATEIGPVSFPSVARGVGWDVGAREVHIIRDSGGVLVTDENLVQKSSYGAAILTAPFGISVNHHLGKVAITDHAWIYLFNLSGRVQSSQLSVTSTPYGVALTDAGRVWVVDQNAETVIGADLNGQVIQTLTGFVAPRSVLFHEPSGCLFVTEYNNVLPSNGALGHLRRFCPCP